MLLETFLSYSWGLDGEKKEPSVPLGLLTEFVEPSIVIEPARKLADADWLTETQHVAVNQFVKEYYALRSGKDPKHPVESEEE